MNFRLFFLPILSVFVGLSFLNGYCSEELQSSVQNACGTNTSSPKCENPNVILNEIKTKAEQTKDTLSFEDQVKASLERIKESGRPLPYTEDDIRELLTILNHSANDWTQELSDAKPKRVIEKSGKILDAPYIIYVNENGFIIDFKSTELKAANKAVMIRLWFGSDRVLEPVVVGGPSSIKGVKPTFNELQDDQREREASLALQSDSKNRKRGIIETAFGVEYHNGEVEVLLRPLCTSSLFAAIKNVTENSSFPELPVLKYLGDVAAGLEYMHSLRYIHRDIKLENILIHSEKAYLADFGRSIPSKKGDGYKMGTPAYNDPAYYEYDKKMSEEDLRKSDIYAFGLTALRTSRGYWSGKHGVHKIRDKQGEFLLPPSDNCTKEKTIKGYRICLKNASARLYDYFNAELASKKEACYKFMRKSPESTEDDDCLEAIILDCIQPLEYMRTIKAKEISARLDRLLGKSKQTDETKTSTVAEPAGKVEVEPVPVSEKQLKASMSAIQAGGRALPYTETDIKELLSQLNSYKPIWAQEFAAAKPPMRVLKKSGKINNETYRVYVNKDYSIVDFKSKELKSGNRTEMTRLSFGADGVLRPIMVAGPPSIKEGFSTIRSIDDIHNEKMAFQAIYDPSKKRIAPKGIIRPEFKYEADKYGGEVEVTVSPHPLNLQTALKEASEKKTTYPIVKAMSDVAAGLEYLHSIDYAHTNVTLQNIFITPTGTAYLSDFSLAIPFKDGTTVVHEGVDYEDPASVGYEKPYSVSPEALQRIDIYTFGLTLLRASRGIWNENQALVANRSETIFSPRQNCQKDSTDYKKYFYCMEHSGKRIYEHFKLELYHKNRACYEFRNGNPNSNPSEDCLEAIILDCIQPVPRPITARQITERLNYLKSF